SIAPRGRIGIIAVNTIAEGDTREVGLDQAIDWGWSIFRANKSQPWPGSASLGVSLLWTGHPGSLERRILDNREVTGITSSLSAEARVSGSPSRLVSNYSQAFNGTYVLGTGFLLTWDERDRLISEDPRSAWVIQPYLNGEDLNSRPDCSASRWVINFR